MANAPSLYSPDLAPNPLEPRTWGLYNYASLCVGIAVALLGLVVAPLRFLYDYAWFVGFAMAGGAYLALMQRSPEPAEMPELEGEV